MGPGGNTGYGLAALRRELAELTRCEHGENNRLNRAAFCLGMLVAGGELDRVTVEEQLTQAALGIGLGPAEIVRTIASGLRRGEQLPRVAPHRLEPFGWQRHRGIPHDLPADAPGIGSEL